MVRPFSPAMIWIIYSPTRKQKLQIEGEKKSSRLPSLALTIDQYTRRWCGQIFIFLLFAKDLLLRPLLKAEISIITVVYFLSLSLSLLLLFQKSRQMILRIFGNFTVHLLRERREEEEPLSTPSWTPSTPKWAIFTSLFLLRLTLFLSGRMLLSCSLVFIISRTSFAATSVTIFVTFHRRRSFSCNTINLYDVLKLSARTKRETWTKQKKNFSE